MTSAAPEPAESIGEQRASPETRDLGTEGQDESASLQPGNQAGTESVLETSDFSADVLRRLSGRTGAFARYRLQGEIARGGQGAVLRIWDGDLRRFLAMKVLSKGAPEVVHQEGSPVDSRSLGRFLEEAQVTGQLDHPGIVPIHELGLDAQGRVYFTMKLVKGKSLKEVFELAARGQEGWTRTKVLSVLLKVCEAMAYAHHKGVVHRDLKPGNVMVGRFGEVYVMDWGLAKVVGRADHADLRIAPHASTEELSPARREQGDSDSPLVTMDGHVVGTPAYMSPEQAHGRLVEVGPHSDVYSAGAMLYHLLAGHAPYVRPGMRISSYAIWYRVQEGPPDPLGSRASDAPAELMAICEKAMARGWHARYRDMGELAADLQAFLERRVVRAYEAGAIAELRKWVQRNRALAGALGTAAVLLVAGLALTLSLKAQSDRNAAYAKERADEAREQQSLAQEAAARERMAGRRFQAFQQLQDLIAEADRLWPPVPVNIARYDSWLGRARDLLVGLEPSPDDPGYRGQLAELRSHMLPQTDEARLAAQHEHPRWKELQHLRQRVAALRAAQEVRAGRAEPVEWELDPAALPSDAQALNALAWPLVEPYRRGFGREAEGLALARLAIERVQDDETAADVGDTLAWALFANGLDEEALAESQGALSAAPENQRKEFEGYHGKLREQIEEAGDGALLAELEQRIGELDAEISSVRSLQFEREEDTWWHDRLASFVEQLEAFAHPETGLVGGISSAHGWGIARRKRWAEVLLENTQAGTEAAGLWSEAIESIADPGQCPLYRGLRIEPQLGLVPIGRDPRSGLWEFAHLLSGAVARRGADGELERNAESGIVLVLLPGGTFWMGAQKDPAWRNFDPAAQLDELVVHEVTLSPFFVSKHEMTFAQWLRFSGEVRTISIQEEENPVDQVSWTDARNVLFRMGLSLPSEAQWEYAARAGSTGPWWTGSDPRELATAANVADLDTGQQSDREEWHDGFLDLAPVGSYRPNAFGLHDVLGNVWEWCEDGYEQFFYGHSPATDPVADPVVPALHVFRGGSFRYLASTARCARRDAVSPEFISDEIGLRPARAVEGAFELPLVPSSAGRQDPTGH